MNKIDSFSGQFRWLSNFADCWVQLPDNELYPSVEHAYQAAKTLDPDLRRMIRELPSAGKAKKAGRDLEVRQDWNDTLRLDTMRELLMQKFYAEPYYFDLLDTGDALIVEGNSWHDNFFGSCRCEKCGDKGQNHLGKMIMEIRDKIRGQSLMTY